jgi:hypothetical protein
LKAWKVPGKINSFRLTVALRGRDIHFELRCSLREILLVVTLANAMPDSDYDQNRQHRDSRDRSPDGNASHRRTERCARLYPAILSRSSQRERRIIVRAIAFVFVSLGVDHWAPPSAIPPCSWRANSSSSSQVNSFFRSKL